MPPPLIRHPFVHAADFKESFAQYEPKSAALLETAIAFAGNINRIHSLGLLPVYLVAVSTLSQQMDFMAKANLGIRDDDPRYILGHKDYDAALDTLRQKARIELSEKYLHLVIKGEKASPKIIGEVNLAALLEGHEDKVALSLGIQSLLVGMVVGAWTAIETLLSDLWLCALNEHPVKLAALSGKWYRAQGAGTDEYDDDEGQEEEGKKVDLNDLMQNGYDLSGKMGTILRRRFKWGVFANIRKAYGSAFSCDFDDIKASIEDPSLDALNAARNILVHKAGIVDREFVRKTNGYGPLASLQANDKIVLSGIMVRDLLGPAVLNANSLLKSVDGWITTH